MFNFSDPHVARQDPLNAFDHQFKGLPADPHQPGSVASFPFQRIDTPEVRERTRGYYNSVERLDAGMGMLMAMLQSAGKLDDTLIIFVGDHGPPFSRGKTSCYEAGVKVPFLVRYPGHQQTGAVRTHKFVSTIDIVPTVLAATGTAAPAGLPGRSLLPLLAAWDIPWRRSVATEYGAHHLTSTFYPRRAIRSGRYKYIANLASGRPNPVAGIDADLAFRHSRRAEYVDTVQGQAMTRLGNPPAEELYDVVADPAEFRNLAGDVARAATLADLRAQLAQWQAETDDPLRDPAVPAAQTAEQVR